MMLNYQKLKGLIRKHLKKDDGTLFEPRKIGRKKRKEGLGIQTM